METEKGMVESEEGSSKDKDTEKGIVESGEWSSNFDSADIRKGRQKKEWWRVVRGAAILTVQI
jgi:hypothetical protein